MFTFFPRAKDSTNIILTVLLITGAFADRSYDNSTTSLISSSDVGAYILKGLGATSSSDTSSQSSSTIDYFSEYHHFESTAIQPSHSINASYWQASLTTVSSVGQSAITAFPNITTSSAAIADAIKCFSSVSTWRLESEAFWNSKVANHSWPLSSFWSSATGAWSKTTTIYPANASTYKLCDGTPRVNARPKTYHLNDSTTIWTSFTKTLTPTFKPEPCSVVSSECRMLFYDTNAKDQAYDELLRQCGLPAHLYEEPSCLLGGGPVELVYFPVQRDNRSLCTNSSGTTAKPLLPGLSEITTLGHTFTSDSVYLSFKTLYAYYDGFGDRVGPSFTDLVVPLHSTDISSHCGGWFAAYGPGTQLNYADLNWPVPASAYKCQARCSMALTGSATIDPSVDDDIGWVLATLPTPPECNTIWEDVNPVLAVPTKIREMVPEWSTCSFWNQALANFWFDPPLALQEASVEATITAPSSPPTTAAAPSSKPDSPTATSTPTAESEVLQTSSSSQVAPATQQVPSSASPSSPDISQEASGTSQDPDKPATSSTAIAPALSILSAALSTTETASAIESSFSFDPLQSSELSASDVSLATDPTKSIEFTPTSGVVLSIKSVVKTIIYTSDYYVLGSETVSVGQATTISGEEVSADVSGLVLGSQTAAISTLHAEDPGSKPSVLQANGFTITVSAVHPTSGDPRVVVVEHTTISEGGPAATIRGHVVSQGPNGLVMQGSQTISFSEISLPTIVSGDSDDESVMAAGSLTVTASALTGYHSGVVIDGTTLSQDGPFITKDGHAISYGSSGLVLVDAQSTAAFTAADITGAHKEDQMIWTLGSLTVTAATVTGDPSAISVHGTTLTEGGQAVTIDGATVTMGSSGLEVIKSHTTERMETVSTGTSSQQSSVSSSMVGGPSSAGASSPSAAFTTSPSSTGARLHGILGNLWWLSAIIAYCMLIM